MFSFSNKAAGTRQGRCKACAVLATLDWERRNPEKKKAAGAIFRQRHRSSETQRQYAWRAKNPEVHKATQRRYMQRHPEKNLQWLSNRRARKLAAPGYATAEQIIARVEYYGRRCYMCGGPYEHLDHVIPIARGGSNWPANLRPSCAPCNMRKHDRLYIPNKGEVFGGYFKR